MLKVVIFALFDFLRLPALLRFLLDESARRRALGAVVAGPRTQFGPAAVVHNPTGERGRIRLGAGTLVDGELLVHEYGGQIEIGDHTYIGLGSRVWSGERVRIGSHVFLAHNVNVTDTNSHAMSAAERARDYEGRILNGQPFVKGSIQTSPVTIGDHAWINFNVGILRGVTIGEGAIVGAGSLVTKDVAPYTFVAGNPARLIRELGRE